MAVEEISYRRSVWVSSLIALVGLALFIGIAALIPPPAGQVGVLLLSLFLALIPAAIWLVFFYQQDRAEPEPKQLVVRIFAFGALAAVVAVLLATQLMTPVINQFPSLVVRLLLTIATVALMQEALKVAMVRYVVLGTREFDRHPDGVVYGLASGLGFATVLNVAFVIGSGGVLPLAGAVRAVDNVLVHSALGALSGYYIGRVKLDGKSVAWMAQGLAIVAVLNGLYQTASSELSSRLVFNPWYSLAAALALALLTGVALFAILQRAIRRAVGDLQTVSIQSHARSKEMPWDIKLRYDWLLIGALALAVAVGLGAGALLWTRTLPYSGSELAADFRYPAGWAVGGGDTGGLTVQDLSVEGLYKPTLAVTHAKVREGADLNLLVADIIGTRSGQLPLYTETSRETGLMLSGYPAVRSYYQYAAATGGGPAVVSGVATYVLVDAHLYTFSYEAEPAAFDGSVGAYEQLLASVAFRAGQ
jgi:RsiW-degrading membrane proteinase PrsW (M82 family)